MAFREAYPMWACYKHLRSVVSKWFIFNRASPLPQEERGDNF
jgi:hypothetical protein